MSRRERFSEEHLAWDDERRDAIDRIAGRCSMAGVSTAEEVIRAIREALVNEMPRLVPVRWITKHRSAA